MADILFVRLSPDKFWLGSGEFTAVIKTSQTSSQSDPRGAATDGTNFYWCNSTGFQKRISLQSGIFSSSLKAQEVVYDIDSPFGISFDGTDTPWIGGVDAKLYLQSGPITAVLKTSESVSSIDTQPYGISFDGVNTLWCGRADDKLYLHSGEFTSTLKTSQYIGDIDTSPTGISWNGTDTLWCGSTDGKFYMTSGQYSDTIKTSEGSAANTVTGIGGTDFDARVQVPLPEINVTPAGLTFGDVEITTTFDLETTIENLGTGDLTISGLTVDNNLYTIIEPISVPFVLGIAGSTIATIRYSPITVGNTTGSFDITSDDADEPTTYISLDGTGVEYPDINATPMTLSYGNINLGDTSDLSTTISNTGTGDLIVSGMTVDNYNYTIIGPAVPFTVEAAGSTDATVRFSPTVATTESGTFNITSNDSINSVIGLTLDGFGITPEIDIDPMSLNFGNIDVGNTFDLTTTIDNLGNADLTVSGLTVDNDAYTIITPSLVPFVLSVAGSTEATIRFTPVVAGTITSTFTVASDDLDEAEVGVSLSGNGIMYPEIDVVPTSLSYGSVDAGSISDLITTISNTGNDTLIVSGMTVDNDTYTIISPIDVPFNVSASGSTDAIVRYSPLLGGTDTGTFTISSDDLDEPTVDVTLDGFGNSVPEIDVDPTSLSFGDIDTNTTFDLTTTIYNTGIGNLIVSGMTVDNNLYTIISPISVPFNVSASGSTVATIRFSPIALGLQSGTFTISSDDSDEPTVAVTLDGTSVQPVEESSINFNLYIDQSVNFDLEM